MLLRGILGYFGVFWGCGLGWFWAFSGILGTFGYFAGIWLGVGYWVGFSGFDFGEVGLFVCLTLHDIVWLFRFLCNFGLALIVFWVFLLVCAFCFD